MENLFDLPTILWAWKFVSSNYNVVFHKLYRAQTRYFVLHKLNSCASHQNRTEASIKLISQQVSIWFGLGFSAPVTDLLRMVFRTGFWKVWNSLVLFFIPVSVLFILSRASDCTKYSEDTHLIYSIVSYQGLIAFWAHHALDLEDFRTQQFPPWQMADG